MILDNVRLKSETADKIKSFKFKKIKLKKLSFQGVYDNWRKFRLSFYKKSLENKQGNLVNMSFREDQLNSDKNYEYSENRVLGKTKAIARLESKIKFLETGNYSTEEFVNNRAIKLKNTMMKNLRYNQNSLYSLPTDMKKAIFADDFGANAIEENKLPDTTEPVTIPASIEQEGNNTYTNTDSSNNEVETDSQIHVQDDTIDNNQELAPITADEVAEAIKNEMHKIRIDSNNGLSQSTNKFINEDGTYSMKKEDIEENFRITRIDNNIGDENTEKKSEIEASPISNTSESEKDPIEIQPTSNKENNDHGQDDEFTPLVVPEKDSTALDAPTEKESQVNALANNLNTLLERVRILSERREKLKEERAAVAETAIETDKNYADKVAELAQYAEFLESDCEATEKENSAKRAETMEKQAEIQAIEMMLGQNNQDIPQRRM